MATERSLIIIIRVLSRAIEKPYAVRYFKEVDVTVLEMGKVTEGSLPRVA